MQSKMTKAQWRVFVGIRNYQQKTRTSPSYAELAEYLGIVKNAAYKSVQYLIQKGYIKTYKGKICFIDL